MAYTVFILDKDAPSTFGGADIETAVDWSTTQSGSVVDGNSDGNSLNQAVFVDNIGGDITITAKNPKQFEGSGFAVGTCGSLVIKAIARDCGSETLPATKISRTYGEAVITNISDGASHEGESTASITFRVFDNGTGSLFATS